MMRFFVLLLLLVNGVYFAWSHSLLKAWGFGPLEVSEPQRLAQQIKPQAIRVLAAGELVRIEAAPQTTVRPGECLVAGGFDETQTAALRRAMPTSVPTGVWAIEGVNEPDRWIVHMGPYTNSQVLAAKRAELASLKLRFEVLADPALEPGLSLGAFPSKKDAEAALAALSKRGVRTASVVQERRQSTTWQLKFASVDEALRARLEDLKPLLAGKPLRACN